MDASRWIDAVTDNAKQLAAAARQAGLAAPVPTCPEWKVADLIAHVGGVHILVSGIVEDRAQRFPGRPEVTVDESDPVGWFEAGVERLCRALREVGEDTQVWNWSGRPGPATFWHRRMAHELVIHRVDAEAAAGIAGVVEPAELAADGIDECLEMLERIPAWRKGVYDGLEASYHFHATDTPGEWVLRFGGGRLAVSREHAKADVAVRGPAGALELAVYNRAPFDRVEVLGDAGLVDAWRERIHI